MASRSTCKSLRYVSAITFLLGCAVVHTTTQENGTLPANCSDGDVRLMDGRTPSEGRVEICFNRTWGTVCRSGFGQLDASVVCQQLGYSRLNPTVTFTVYGSGAGPMFLESINCSGSEEHVVNCSRSFPVGIHRCTNHTGDAGVRCTVRENCTDGEVRLVGGHTELEGRVEICFDGVWGTVCRRFWYTSAATVVCRQLGFTTEGSQALLRPPLAPTSDPIFLDHVMCNGSESYLTNCTHRGIGIHDCSHFKDAGVACLGPCSEGSVRIIRDGSVVGSELSAGSGTFGRVEVCVGGMFSATICSDLWDSRDASVLCRQLGYSPYGATVISDYGQQFGGVVRSILSPIGDCTGSESTLQNCSSAIFSNETFKCNSSGNVGVVCQSNNILPSNCTDGDMRLVSPPEMIEGGSALLYVTGRVEVCFNHAWGTVCQSEWQFSNHDAAMICQQLGLSPEGAMKIFPQSLTPACTPIFLTSIKCCGFETSLLECAHRYPIGISDCRHHSDLHLQCSVHSRGNTAVRNLVLPYLAVERSSCVEGDVQFSDVGFSSFSPFLLAASGGRLGRVEICMNGRHIGVDGDSWDNEDASVLCRQLGFSPYGAIAIDDCGNFAKPGQFPVVDGVANCDGSEETIQECLTLSPGFTCSRNYVGVVCQGGRGTVPSKCTDGELRLVNGSVPTEGRVEICFNHAWGTVCSNKGTSDGVLMVACRTLGFFPFGGVGGLDFGSGSGPIFVEQPFCSGFEDSILDCTSRHQVGVHQCDHSSDVGIRCQEFQSGSLVFLRLSTLNLTAIKAHLHYSRFTRSVLLQLIRLSIRQSATLLPTGNVTARGSTVNSDCKFVTPRRLDTRHFWLRIECEVFELPASNTTLQYVREISEYMHISFVSQFGFIINSSQAVSVNGFCDHNRTRSSIDGNYSWEESTAGLTVTQACVFGTDVDGGKARRECGADARWREPDFTQCIDRLSDIKFIPEEFNRVYFVVVGRRFRLRCQSAGPYAGRVIWMHQNEEVSPVFDLQEVASGGQSEAAEVIFPIESGDGLSLFIADPTNLYQVRESEDVVYLVTHPQYGAVQQVGGKYTCLAVNEYGNFTEDISVNITELLEVVSYTIFRFSVDGGFQEEPLLTNYLLHLQTVFLDALDAASQTDIRCKPVVRRPEDLVNSWSRVECNVTSMDSLEVKQFIQDLQSGTIDASFIEGSIITSDFGFCDYDITQTDSGSYTWEETEGNMEVSQTCALGAAMEVSMQDAVARRMCNVFGEWEDPNVENCISIVSRQFQDLNTVSITQESIGQVALNLSEVVREASRRPTDQTRQNLAVVLSVFDRIATLVSHSQTANVDQEMMNNFVKIVDDLIVWPETVLERNSSRVIQCFETLANNHVEQENFTNVMIVERDVAFVGTRSLVQQFQGSGSSFSSSRYVDGRLAVDISQKEEDEQILLPGEVAYAFLPATVFRNIVNMEEISVFFSLYKESSFFPIPDAPNGTRIASPVVAATVAGRTFRDLQDPVIILIRLDDVMDGNITGRRCVSWDFSLAGGRGNWTTEGCQTLDTSDEDVVMCSCNHLTNFACLVDICARTGGCETPPRIAFALTIISIVGVVLSLLGLLLTVITLLIFKKLRQRDATKFHIQLCIALFCMLLVFVVGIDQTNVYGGCVTVSVLIHYFTLVAVMWMGAEAVLMFQKLVIIFVRITTRYIVAVSLVCWLVPLVPVVIPLALDRNFILTFDETTSPQSIQFCFIGNTGVFFGAFLGPIFAILLFNSVIFVAVVMVLIRHCRNTSGRTREQMTIATAIRLVISITGVMFLFGLTWLFAALTVSAASLVFQILFALFNSLQGFFIFLFFCVFSSDARESWKQALCCGRYKPGSLSHPKVTGDTARQKEHILLPTTLHGHSTKLGSERCSSEMDTSVSYTNPAVVDNMFPSISSHTVDTDSTDEMQL